MLSDAEWLQAKLVELGTYLIITKAFESGIYFEVLQLGAPASVPSLVYTISKHKIKRRQLIITLQPKHFCVQHTLFVASNEGLLPKLGIIWPKSTSGMFLPRIIFG